MIAKTKILSIIHTFYRNFSLKIPIIDISPLYHPNPQNFQKVGQQIDQANRTMGFFLIKNTGIDFSFVSKLISTSQSFFDSPLDNKMTCRNPDPQYLPWGYFPRNMEQLQRGKDYANPKDDYMNDVNEQFNLQSDQPASLSPLRQFPPNPTEFKQVFESYYKQVYELSNLLMKGFAAGLGISTAFFDDKFTYGSSCLRVLHYPKGEKLKPGQFRASEHTDYGALTLLYSTASGLQVKDRKGDWVDIEVPYEHFVVNIGDLMAFWTNDQWISNPHRVIGKEAIPKRRISVAFFHNPNHDADIECIPSCVDVATKMGKYEKVKSGDFIMKKFKASVGEK